MKSSSAISFIIAIGILYVFQSCNSTKYVSEGEFLLTNNSIEEFSPKKKDTLNYKKVKKEEIKSLIIQRPNKRTFGIPFPLHFYNLGNRDYEKEYQKRRERNPKTYQFLKSVFSEKQTLRMGDIYKNRNKWFLTKGEAPVILDLKKTKKSEQKLRTYYFNQGYFKAKVKTEEKFDGTQKRTIAYKVTKNHRYFLDTIYHKIDSKIIDSIYQKNKEFSLLKKGDPYQDLNFRKEAKRLITLFRNSGIYDFSENLIGFYEIDTSATNYKTNVLLKIRNPLLEKNGDIKSDSLRIKRISKITIKTDESYSKRNDPYLDTVHYKGYTFLAHDKLKYRPKALLNSIFIEPNQIYKDSARNLTRSNLRRLNNFKSSLKINYSPVKGSNDKLTATISLEPLKKYSIGLNTEIIHSNIKQVGFSGGFSFTNRNMFRGAEIFKLSFQGAIFDLANNTATNATPFNSWELGADASLQIPRIALPFNTSKIIPKRTAPKTLFSLGTSFQKNIGLDRQKFTGIVEFSWQSSKRKKHAIELINAQYVKNLNQESYFSIYSSEFSKLKDIQTNFFPTETLTTNNALNFIRTNINSAFNATNPTEFQTAKNIEKRQEILTTNNLSPLISYSYTYNSQQNYRDVNYILFKAKIATSGNLTSAFTKTTSGDIKTLLDIPIAQFVKGDFEFKKFWLLSKARSQVLGYRSFLGIAIPYGNSDEIPFTNSYFIGGSNDIRAWRTYELGPGSSNTGLEFNVSNFKFLTSLEFRSKIFGSLNGALFIDAGNIWDITNSDLTNEDEKFTSLKSLQNIAIGSGFGIRYDFSFLVLRLDLAFKTYEPYLEQSNKWFQNYEFSKSVLNIGINYPF